MYEDEVHRPRFDLGEFRYAVAPYIKLLIAARWKQEPNFLSPEEMERWQITHREYDDFPCWNLIEKSAKALGRLNDEYLPRCGSAGVAVTDDTTPEGRLIENLAFFVPAIAGGPHHNGWLLQVADRLQDDENADWIDDVKWDLLPTIRDDLDKLPHPRPPGDWSNAQFT